MLNMHLHVIFKQAPKCECIWIEMSGEDDCWKTSAPYVSIFYIYNKTILNITS